MITRRWHRSFIAFALIFIPHAAGAKDTVVVPLAYYENVTSATGEHCEGWDLTLWKYEKALLGMINHHRGLCGDPPAGRLENVRYESATGALSFWAKLSEGLDVSQGIDKARPSRDLIHFDGRLLKNLDLAGKITWHDADHPAKIIGSEQVSWKPAQAIVDSQGYPDITAWKKAQDAILQFRGPKW